MKRIRDLDVASALERVAAFSVRRALAIVAAVAALALLGLLLALTLDTKASSSTLADGDTASSKATDELHARFGDEPIVVLVRGRLTGVLLTQDVARLLGLEGCISGKAPPGAKAPAPVCRELARRKPVKVVYGPGTFINEAASRILDQLGIDPGRRERDAAQADRAARRDARRRGLGASGQDRAAQRARQQVDARYAQEALQQSLRYGLTGVPALNNPEFVLQLVFDPALGAEIPKPRFSYVFPTKDAAVIQARLRPGLSASERRRAIARVEEAVGSPAFDLKFGRYLVSGPPVLEEKVASSLPGTLVVSLVAAALLTALMLTAFFRRRPGLLPLALALATAAVTFGVVSLAAASLTIASVAALPVLIGLAACYAIQFQARFEERGLEAARAEGPVLATAGLASVAGFLALLLSPVPMVRWFGALIVLGIVAALAIALTAGFAVLGAEPPVTTQLRRRFPKLFGRLGGRGLPRLRAPARSRAASRLAWLERLRGFPAGIASLLKRWGRRGFDQALTRPRRVLWIALAVALAGVALATQLDVESDPTKLAPQHERAVEDAKALQRETGVSGDVSVLVHGDDLADPRAIAWMADYQRRVLKRHGYRDGRPCQEADLCPALSITNFFGGRPPKTREEAKALFDTLPAYFSQNVITPDRRTANLAFGVHTMPLDEQKRLIDDMRAQLDPPPGVSAELAGSPVLAAETGSSLRSSRWTLSLVALGAVLAALLAVYRRVEGLVPIVPAGFAACWSGLVLFILRIPLNPLSATLGALVIAISSALCVILTARYRSERAGGVARAPALERAYGRIGGSVLASCAVLVAAFAALIASDFKMLRDFGLVAAVDLTVVLVGVMLVLPAALALAEEGVRVPSPAELRRALPAAGRRLRASAPFRK